MCVCVYVCVVSECHSGTSTIKTPRPRGGCLTIKETCNAICHLQCLVALNQHFQQYVRSAQCAAPTQALPCTPQMSLYHGICCTGTFCVIVILFQLSLLLLAPLLCLHSTCYIFLLLSSPCFRIFSASFFDQRLFLLLSSSPLRRVFILIHSIPETNYVPREYSVAAILLLLFMVFISLVSVLFSVNIIIIIIIIIIVVVVVVLLACSVNCFSNNVCITISVCRPHNLPSTKLQNCATEN